MVYSVKQLTEGYRCITVWRGSGFTWPFAPGEQKKLNGLTLHQRVLGSSPRRLTAKSLISWAFLWTVSHQGYGPFAF
jgi:hypothetical protein